ncbi:11323_t:CDS:1 [Acaulospora colombiana]|uniref:11323_t:CDS:1 n=1 Tax=Acaulospora colombiana TaxID=27376 RepID=A0ACA9PF13_9GLOM|nr:11323_t:CDS:1 [Acaulospora colombiana]
MQRFYSDDELYEIPEEQSWPQDGTTIPGVGRTNSDTFISRAIGNTKKRKVSSAYKPNPHYSIRAKILNAVEKQALDPTWPSAERTGGQNDEIIKRSILSHKISTNVAWALYEEVKKENSTDPVKAWLNKLGIPCSGSFRHGNTKSGDPDDLSEASSLASLPPSSKAKTQNSVQTKSSTRTHILAREKGHATTESGEKPPQTR